jgi:phosphoribosylaminoimidazole-succinocarboxamide synthase
MPLEYNKIKENIENCIDQTNLKNFKKIHIGKVRDAYEKNGKRIIITTDRQSAFDKIVGLVPFKGEVLNRLALFWFEKTSHIIKNHIISSPNANTIITENIKIFPVEFVIRAYMTGTTNTSIWINYKNGVRNFCGNKLPDNLKKNDKLPEIIFTPTTKIDKGHDEPISKQEIIDKKLMTEEDINFVEKKALELFKFGSDHCAKNNCILVDTKYEFGKNEKGEIVLADEIHTPDSSRFWEKSSYEENIKNNLEPKGFDKETIRKWIASKCDPYVTDPLPKVQENIIIELSMLYQEVYEIITKKKFIPENSDLENIIDKV